VLIDLFYDHFLATSWNEWSKEPLDQYLRRVRRIIQGNYRHLPERLRSILPIVFEELIPSYLDPDGIATALKRMSRRVRRENPLAAGGEELKRHYLEFAEDFREFLPEARRHAERFLSER
jgi:acyl carrier protein phosphodiesterase